MRGKIELETETVTMLQKGDRVIIYHDPFTRSKPEGTAILVKRLSDNDPEQQRWLVMFEGEEDEFGRFIVPPWEVVVDQKAKLAEAKYWENHPFKFGDSPEDGITCDAHDRARKVKDSTNPAWLRRVVALEGVQKTVKEAAERRLRALWTSPRKVRHRTTTGNAFRDQMLKHHGITTNQ